MSTPAPKTVVITGASGVVGLDLVERLKADHHVVAFARSPEAVPGVEVVKSDLSLPRLGLSEAEWNALADRIDVVVHSGAITTWGLAPEAYLPVNVEGTRTVVELARRAGAPIHLISSCFVHALSSPCCDEILGPSNVVRPYITSKREAERIVRESGLPYNIYRPTNLVGHSRTGRSSRPQIVQMMCDWIARGKAPYFPAHAGNVIDVAPLDMVSDAVAGVIDAADFGEELWVTYGAASLTVDEALAEVVRHVARSGRTLPVAPIADPREEPPVAMAQVPAMSRTFLKVLIDVSEVTYASGGILPTSLATLRSKYGASEISCAEAFRRGLEYWAARRAADSAEEKAP